MNMKPKQFAANSVVLQIFPLVWGWVGGDGGGGGLDKEGNRKSFNTKDFHIRRC